MTIQTRVGQAGALVLALAGLPAASAAPAPIAYEPETLVQVGVSDLDRAIAFYTEVLGFTLTERRDDLQFAHIATNVPGLEIGLDQVEEPKGSGSVVINISVEHVGEARRVLEAKGVVFRGETLVIPGKVALAGFSDPDGNYLRFAGPAETAE
jgi:CreA protein